MFDFGKKDSELSLRLEAANNRIKNLLEDYDDLIKESANKVDKIYKTHYDLQEEGVYSKIKTTYHSHWSGVHSFSRTEIHLTKIHFYDSIPYGADTVLRINGIDFMVDKCKKVKSGKYKIKLRMDK